MKRFLIFFSSLGLFFSLSTHANAQWDDLVIKIDYSAWSAPAKPRIKDVRAAFGYLKSGINSGAKSKLTRAWRRDRHYRVIFLSLSQGQRPAKVFLGVGNGYRAALDQIIKQTRDQPQLAGSKWLKLDILAQLEQPQLARHGKVFPLNYTLEGLANGDGAWALLPGEILARDAFKEGYLMGHGLSAALRMSGRHQIGLARQFRDPGIAVRRFQTFGYFSNHTEVYPLFRDHRLLQSPTMKTLEEAMAKGIDYLVRVTKDDGSFVYTYLDSAQPQYSLARHGGTLFSMADYYKDYPNTELMTAIDKARDYLLAQSKPFSHDKEPVPVLVERGAIKLTVMALGVLALVECYKLSADPEVLQKLRGYATYIANSQLDNGRFYSRRDYKDGRWRKEMESLYAPGEAVFALANLYMIDPDPRWLEVAKKGAGYLIQRQKVTPMEQLEHDHWLLYALNALHSIEPSQDYLAVSLRITQAIEQLQRKQSPIPDWVGSYYDPPRSTPTATRSEGLLAAFQLAIRADQPKQAQRIWDIAKRSVSFQLQTQFRPENTMYLGYPQKTLGGFRGSFGENMIRIDYVQHNLSALLTMTRALKSGQAGK